MGLDALEAEVSNLVTVLSVVSNITIYSGMLDSSDNLFLEPQT
jgi:hypothetical protein